MDLRSPSPKASRSMIAYEATDAEAKTGSHKHLVENHESPQSSEAPAQDGRSRPW